MGAFFFYIYKQTDKRFDMANHEQESQKQLFLENLFAFYRDSEYNI